MSAKIEIPFSTNAPAVWAAYLQGMVAFIKGKLEKISSNLLVDPNINSVKKTSYNAWVGFTDDSDWITIDDNGPEETSRRIFITFSDVRSPEGISFECMEGPIDDDNVRYKEFSEMKFSADVLENDKIYAEFAKWLGGGSLDVVVFEKHEKRLYPTKP